VYKKKKTWISKKNKTAAAPPPRHIMQPSTMIKGTFSDQGWSSLRLVNEDHQERKRRIRIKIRKEVAENIFN